MTRLVFEAACISAALLIASAAFCSIARAEAIRPGTLVRAEAAALEGGYQDWFAVEFPTPADDSSAPERGPLPERGSLDAPAWASPVPELPAAPETGTAALLACALASFAIAALRVRTRKACAAKGDVLRVAKGDVLRVEGAALRVRTRKACAEVWRRALEETPVSR